MILTDTHTHLYSEAFDDDREELIRKAMQLGVKRFFLPALDSSYTGRMKQLKDKFPEEIFLMTGLHPTHVKEDFKEELRRVKEELDSDDYVAVGEIGIDLYWDTSNLEAQIRAFRYQIQLAKEHRLPIVIHCRDGFEEVFKVLELEKGPDLRGIFHCFTGTLEDARRAISYNMLLGIGGVVTFKNGKIDQFLHELDLKHIVLETDAPYLAPVPYRGKRNESAYLIEVLKKVAEIYGLTQDEVAAVTTENSKRIFGI